MITSYSSFYSNKLIYYIFKNNLKRKRTIAFIMAIALLCVNIMVTALIINADPGSELGTFA